MRLTLFSKLLILAIILAILAGIYVKRDKLGLGGSSKGPGSPAGEVKGPDATPGPGPAAPVAGAPANPANPGQKHRIVVGVNDFGGAYAGLVANDGATAGPNSLFSKAGLDVEIKLVRGSKERLDQFNSGGIDVMLLTLDYVANLYADYKAKGSEVQSFLFVDWSRGNLGIVAKPGFDSIESLKTARIATTRNTPTHYFSLVLLDRSNLKPNEIEVVKSGFEFSKKTPDAAAQYLRGEVDAAALWDPHLTKALEGGKGKLLVSTATASNLIADVLFARKEFLDAHAEVMPAFCKAWLEGGRRMKDDPSGSVQLIAKAFAQTPEETQAVMGKVKAATFADNRAFFGLETERSPFATLLTEAGEIWKREGVIQEVPNPKAVARTGFLEAIKADYANEQIVEDWKFDAAKASGQALLSKSMSIYFAPGSAELDANARQVVDRFADLSVGVFQNAYVRVEGNTDSTGARAANVTLSQKRAQAVVDYLVNRYRFQRERFVAVGNGPDRPVGDNKTNEGREWNRRTDFRIVPNY